MKARSLKHKITFQEQTDTLNEYGEAENTWNDIVTVWASIKTINGNEKFLSSQDFQTLTHKIRVRYSDQINSKQRIMFGTREFNILAVLNIFEANKELEILVEEAV